MIWRLAFTAIITAPPYDGPWRKSLNSCWRNASCARALTVSHGGDWNLTYPYDSAPAFSKAWADGADAIKGDFRVSADGVGVICHSSPFEIYESLNCAGQRVETMTAAAIQHCTMALSPYTFITAASMLALANGKVNVMWCVKQPAADLAVAIAAIIAAGAQERVFLEVRTSELLAHAPAAPGFEQVRFLVEIGSPAEIDAMLGSGTPPALLARCFMFEFDPGYTRWANASNAADGGKFDVGAAVARLHAAGIRTLAATSSKLPTVRNHLDIWRSGIDVVYTYNLQHATDARVTINTERGIAPP